MRSLILLCLLCSTSAKPEDLSGKSMTFLDLNRAEDDHTHVILPMAKRVDSATLCLRYLMDRIRESLMFSISHSDPSHSGVYLEKSYDEDERERELAVFQLFVNGTSQARFSFPGPQEKRTEWNSLCVSWDAQKGSAALYLNGVEKGSLKETPAEPLSGPPGDGASPRVTLGRRYDAENALWRDDDFDVELKDVHVWDSVLSSAEIQKYIDDKTGSATFTSGNVVNWKALNFEVKGKFLLLRELNKCE
ncbi:serum amyloid P-component-like [Engraulis encrasicolus]|uniref:serum amyloid P-component-like n=1 Tax=Engraulis encrasicolus TaxID=184585 RepID=UPI002FD6DB30